MLPAGEAWGPGTLSIFLGLEEATHLCTVHMPRVLAGVSSELPGSCNGSSHSCAHRGRCGEKAAAIVGLRTSGHTGPGLQEAEKGLDWEKHRWADGELPHRRMLCPDSVQHGGPGSGSEGSDPLVQICHLLAAKNTALGQGFWL